MNCVSPACWSLVTAQMRARWSRTLGGFRSPRRLILSILAAVLAIAWIGQAVAGVVLRESADPDRLRHWIMLSLTAYLLWNVVRIFCSKPIEPFEWTPAEQEWLLASPIPRFQQIQYRVIGIGMAGLFKATIFSVVMIPDLFNIPMGFLGMFAALLFIDLVRLTLEVIVYGLSDRERQRARMMAIVVVLGLGAAALAWSMQHSNVLDDLASAASLGFLLNWLQGMAHQAETVPGTILTAPFGLFADVVLTRRLDFWLVARLTGGLLIVLAAYWALLDLDVRMVARRRRLDVRRYGSTTTTLQRNDQSPLEKTRRLTLPRRLCGIGPLAWRQWQGVKHYKSSLAVAVIAPVVLACLPALSKSSSDVMVLNLIAGLVFYSFLLMPTTFKFDFRRDVFRLAVLKSLPASPFSIVMGQLATPVLLTAMYQFTVLSLAFVLNPYPVQYLVLGMLILFPVNFVIFGFDNLVFLLYPHRINQEGIRVFLRSILTFTAKGLLFATGLAATFGWIYVSIRLGKQLSPADPQFGFSMIFSSGICLAMILVASLMLLFLVRAFDRFDPSRDLAGLD